MGSILRPVITALVALIAITIIVQQTTTISVHWGQDELDYALRTATQDATASILKDSLLFDIEAESQDIQADINKASNIFQRSFFSNIGSTLSNNTINETSVSMTGYAGYRSIYGIYVNGTTFTVPYTYTAYIADKNEIVDFTLGEYVYITDASGNETKKKLSDLTEHYFDPTISNKDYHSVVVMSTINKFLTDTYNDKTENVIVSNADTGIEFNLGEIDKASNDETVINTLSSLIDGPSFFAIVDCYDTQLKERVRLLSLGAAELKEIA